MVELPQGVVYIDMLVPEGTSQRVEDLQTRLNLVAAGDWRVLADDGSMERSAQPMQPMRGGDERLWVVRAHPFVPSDNLQEAASVAVELAGMCQARLAAVGVCGLFSWGFVLVDDFHSLFGLLLLDWLYNPRLDASGQVLETDDPATIDAEFQAKGLAFGKLWTSRNSQLLMSQLPPGVLQPVESFQALSLLGPGGRFDPRMWQGLAMQLVLPVLQLSATGPGAAPSAQPGIATPAPVPPHSPASSPVFGAPSRHQMPAAPTAAAAGATSAGSSVPPDDGLTPLARAQREADQRQAAGEAAAPSPSLDELVELAGEVRWCESEQGPLLYLSRDRFDADLIRACQGGDFGGLQRSERPDGQRQELWLAAGSPFVAELPSFSRLFLEGVPLHRRAFEAAAAPDGELAVLWCQLQRVCRVQAVLVDQHSQDRRILVCSAPSLSAATVLQLSTP